LSWDGVSGATTYEIQYRITTDTRGKDIADGKNKNLWITQIIEYTETTATIAGLNANTGYQFQVRAVNAVGKSDWSVASATTKTIAAVVTVENPDLTKAKFSAKPKAFGASAADSATITWGVAADATSYIIAYTIPSGMKGVPGITVSKVLTGNELATATNVGMVTYRIEGLKSSASYKVSIVAKNSSGTTTKAATATVKTLKVDAPTKLASSKAVKPTGDTVNLTWSPPKSGIGSANGYIVEVWAPPASKGAVPQLIQVIWVDKGSTSQEIKDLNRATKYTFRLTTSTGSSIEDRGIESAVANKVISTAK
jgi:hypothetical protein